VALADVVDLLACPVCRGVCTLRSGSLMCERGHAFDVARQGYVNLLTGDVRAGTADTAAMVAARARFLTAGHFAPLTRRLVELVAAAVPQGTRGGAVVDVGAGTGHQLAAVLDALPGRPGLALDLSKHALRRAARAHGRIGAVVCDAWGALPVRDAAGAVALSVFAPRSVAELVRVLEPGGSVVAVTPLAEHLAPLVDRLGLLTVADDKATRLDRQLAPQFRLVDEFEHDHVMRLDGDDVRAVVGMGPSAWHIDAAALDVRVAALPAEVDVTTAVRIAHYRRGTA
jgi:23S rRNA (guanine745-N1)-methyltransferase